jgi:hypothetical protein
MATFTYRCALPGCSVGASAADGLFDAAFPIGTAPARTGCPTCGSDAVRVFTAPALLSGGGQVRSAIERAEKSRFEPDVVTSLPPVRRGRPTRSAPSNPALRRLPRP